LFERRDSGYGFAREVRWGSFLGKVHSFSLVKLPLRPELKSGAAV
jgi:hypothetical protein